MPAHEVFHVMAGEPRPIGGLWPSEPGWQDDYGESMMAYGGYRVYADDTPDEPLIAEADFIDTSDDRDRYCPKDAIVDQDSQNSCLACATAQACQILLRFLGHKPEVLSIADFYGRINGGRDQGGALEDAIVEIVKNGICSTKYADQWDWRKPTFKPGYEEDRRRHTPLKAWHCPTIQHVYSALQRRKVVVCGMDVDDSWKPDAQGVLGPRRTRGGGGHAQCLFGMKSIGNVWHVGDINSWGTKNWGTDGKAWTHPSWLQFQKYPPFALGLLPEASDDPL